MGCNSLSNPYYVDACGIQSAQDLTVYNYFYSNALLTSDSFVIPSCNSTFTIGVSGLAKTFPGCYIWNPLYGYFRVVSYNYSTCELILNNECQTVNAAAGFSIPACTVFLVVDTPCCYAASDHLTYPYLEVDFVVPAEDDCVTLKLTNVYGLVVGQFVEIAGGTYYLSDVLNSTDIVVCNWGFGGIAGSVVYAKNALNEYIVPVILDLQEVCDRAEAATGSLNICKSVLEALVLDGSVVLYVPTLIDTASNFVEFKEPNEAYSYVVCADDWSTGVEIFSQEYEETSPGVSFGAAPDSETVSVNVNIQNDTCRTLQMAVVVDVLVNVTCYPTLAGQYANFSLDVAALAASSPSSSPSESPSISPSTSPSESPSSSPSESPSSSPSSSPSPSASPSSSPSVSPSPSATPSPSTSPSASPSATPSPSASPSSSPSVSPSVSPSPSASPSVSPSVSPSGSPSVSPSVSPSGSPSVSPSVSPSLHSADMCDITLYKEHMFNRSGTIYVGMSAVDWLRGCTLGPSQVDNYDVEATFSFNVGNITAALAAGDMRVKVSVFGVAI